MCRDTKLLRAVIREDMSMAMVDELIKDITRGVEYLDSHFTININDVHKPEGKSLAVSPVLASWSCCSLSEHWFPVAYCLNQVGCHMDQVACFLDQVACCLDWVGSGCPVYKSNWLLHLIQGWLGSCSKVLGLQ